MVSGDDAAQLPESLRDRAPGMHELRSETGFRTLHVSERARRSACC
ncbi:MAG: hypothetical protein U5R48_03155 [Gammaproteobacteria bacterium]|nr:hypothetical protein [Gammaproteobacteria bacterium]